MVSKQETCRKYKVKASRTAAKECTPQPALGLSKGRQPWVAEDKRASPVRAKEARDGGRLDSNSLALHILRRLLQVLTLPQIAPIKFVRTKA